MSQAVHPTGSAITGGEVETLFRRSNSSSSGGGGDGGGTAGAIDGASSSSRIGSALAAAASAGGATARYTHAVDVAAELSAAQRFELERRASLQDDPKYHSGGEHHGESSPLLMVGPFAWEAFSRLESEWPLILACFLVIGVIVLAVVVGGASGLAPCDYAVAHAFLIFPLDATCTRLLLSHGGEFQCPHQYDVKLLGSFDSTLDREQFCARYRAVGPPSSAAARAAAAAGGGAGAGGGPPVNFVVTPHMAAGGLRKLMGVGGSGVPGVAGWSSDLYEGVGASKVLLTAVGIRVDRVLWGQEYALRQRAPTLQYLFFPANDGGGGGGGGSVQRAGRAFASHVVTAPPDFDHLAFAVLNDTSLLRPLPGDSGPRLVSFPQLPNEVGARLRAGKTYEGAARVVGADGVPRMKPVQVTMEEQALYHGVSDEFVTYQRYCAAPDRPKWAVCS